ncbi:MAG: N-glycosylase/DNA lyase [Candidatus Aenigmatarchaeota archaeon]
MKVRQLFSRIEELKRSEVGQKVRQRIKEFERLGQKGNEMWFSELCFCILTANCSAGLGMKIQSMIGKGFIYLPEDVLAEKLKRLGYRFPVTRARFIAEARQWLNIKDIIIEKKPKTAREWLVRHVKGIGWKEASHFLRNVGYKDFAILDRHILRIMAECKLIPGIPRQLSRSLYLDYETRLERLAKKIGLSLAELDLYLWYIKTGKVLK